MFGKMTVNDLLKATGKGDVLIASSADDEGFVHVYLNNEEVLNVTRGEAYFVLLALSRIIGKKTSKRIIDIRPE